ncbi:threonine/serine dehydratase [Catellatospora citrea]|uniref:Threonine dehydratase n=1 Tax=Catellatospora citrea TaxID=53366 RepID=A0A8J3KK78_9ACTN|nr:threonine/serine dehydratase [Catellatospora citrea]RKE08840.1 L-threonine ammonia-lyase [Catellatospora citrea]GIG02465.1 threonine dehydratase [Catellatospora citrea]
MITKVDVADAAARIAGRFRRTPLAAIEPGGLFGTSWLKCEYMQHTGSFKARGALNRVLAAQQAGELDPAVGVVAASGGNAGLAVAYAARACGVPATIFVPATAPAFKVDKLRGLGARVEQHGTEYAMAYEAAVKHAADAGAVYCHAYDQAEMVAGAGTIGLELLADIPGGFDTVLVAVGGGGLMAGIATAVAGQARVVGVEPELAPSLHAALAAGHPVDVAVSGVAADSLGARRVGDIGYAVAVRDGVRSVLVSDDDIVAARRALWADRRIVLEHGAAAALAALSSGAYRPADGERVVVIACGANTDPAGL